MRATLPTAPKYHWSTGDISRVYVSYISPSERGQRRGDQRAVARRRVALDAQEGRRRAARGQLVDDRLEIRRVEDLAPLPLDVRGCDHPARALSDVLPRVLRVLELPQLGR